MNTKTRALKVKSGSKENKISMGYEDSKGIKHLSSKAQHEKTKSWPKSNKNTVRDFFKKGIDSYGKKTAIRYYK